MNSNIRYSKFIGFSINNISDHSEQLTNDRANKEMIELVKKMTE